MTLFPSEGLKSDLRNHQAIVQPRLYDSLMVTQSDHQAIVQPRLYDSLMVTQITLPGVAIRARIHCPALSIISYELVAAVANVIKSILKNQRRPLHSNLKYAFLQLSY